LSLASADQEDDTDATASLPVVENLVHLKALEAAPSVGSPRHRIEPNT
jgi:hypothetical protein